ncbi:MAG: hypothetical protein QOC92_2209 [Acidimicrobiaceae bacterium]|jgi:hypothetical protein
MIDGMEAITLSEVRDEIRVTYAARSDGLEQRVRRYQTLLELEAILANRGKC